MATTSDIRNGLTFRYNGDVQTVVSFQHVKQGRGSAFVRVKMKSLTTGKVIEKSFGTNDKIDDIRVERRKCQYLYDDQDALVFMDNESYEQFPIRKEMIEALDLLKEGEDLEMLFDVDDDNKPLIVEMPQFVVREITYTEPGLKGDTATNTLKPAKVETGAEIKVPLFIKEGDKIKIDTIKKSYVERVKS